MGTDIHGVFQRHDSATGTWVGVESNYRQVRHHQLFAVLAGVRNGTGFAGLKTGDAVTPISKPRGYPEGFAVGDDDVHTVARLEHIDPRRREWRTPDCLGEGENPLDLWLGDHSHSWLTGEEMLAWYATAPSAGLRQELAYFFDEVARLQAEHGQVRFVFGFDS